MPRTIKTEESSIQTITVIVITVAVCLYLLDSLRYGGFYSRVLNRMVSDIVTHI